MAHVQSTKTILEGITFTDVLYQAGKRIELREKKGSVKIWELDSNNRDVDRESLDSLRPIGILSLHS